MKKLYILSLLFLLWAIPVLGANTHSIDLETGSTQALTILDADQTGLDTFTDISIEAWIKLESGSAEDGIVTKYDFGTGERGYALEINPSNVMVFYVSDDGSSGAGHFVSVTGTTALDTGTWYHVALTFDISQDTGEIYIDSVDDSASPSGTMGASIVNNTATFSIGSFTSSRAVADSFDGKIDDVRVWNDVRTQQEIADNYQKELTGSEDNLVGYWKVNDSLLDETTNDNDLTNINTAVFSTDIPSWAPADTCTCPTDGSDYYVHSSDNCYLSANCDLDTGGLFLLNTGEGAFNIIDGAELSITKLESTSTDINVEAGCKILFK